MTDLTVGMLVAFYEGKIVRYGNVEEVTDGRARVRGAGDLHAWINVEKLYVPRLDPVAPARPTEAEWRAAGYASDPAGPPSA